MKNIGEWGENMEIENLSILLSALIAALPTVMSLGIVAILAFPSRRGPVSTDKYYICTGLFVPVLFLNKWLNYMF